MDRRDRLFMLLLVTLHRSQLACFHVQDAQGEVCVGHEQLRGEVRILTDCDRVVQGASKMRVVEALTRVFHLSYHSKARTSLIEVNNLLFWIFTLHGLLCRVTRCLHHVFY